MARYNFILYWQYHFPLRYFGAARDLPGVRELFEQARKLLFQTLVYALHNPSSSHSPCLSAAKPARKTRGELAKLVDADYYGYRDEDDGIIVPLEQEREKEGQ